MRFDWGSLEWLVNSDLIPGAELTFGYCEIARGEQNARHLHPNCDEALFVIDGSLDHEVGDEMVRVSAGTALHIPRQVPHMAINVGEETARMVVAYSAGDRETVFADRGPSEGSGARP